MNTNKTVTTGQVIKRLAYLADKLAKYSHRWSETPSARMYAWVDEYQDLREQHYHGAWEIYCEERSAALDHDAYDCLA